MRQTFLSFQLTLLFFLFNPALLTLFSTSHNTYDLQRITEWGVFLVALLHFAFDRPLSEQALLMLQHATQLTKISLVLLLALGIVSSLHAVYPLYALMEVATIFACGMTLLYFASLFVLERANVVRASSYFMILTFSMISLIALIARMSTQEVSAFLAAPGYMNPRFYDDVQCMALPILTGLVLVSTFSTPLRIFIFILLVYCDARAILGGSRVYYYELFALLLMIPFLFRRKALPYLTVYSLAIPLALLMVLLFYGEPAARSLSDLDGRGLLWSIAFHLARTHPLLGVGPLHFNLYAYSLEPGGNYAAHPHSIILALAAEWGLPALMITGALVLPLLWKWFRRVYKDVRQDLLLRMSLSGSIIAGTIMMQVDGLIFMPAGEMMLCFVSGLMLGSHFRESENPPPEWARPAFLLFNLLALGCIFMVGLPIFLNLPWIIMDFLSVNNAKTLLSPNYWSEGFIQFYRL